MVFIFGNCTLPDSYPNGNHSLAALHSHITYSRAIVTMSALGVKELLIIENILIGTLSF